MPVPADDLPMLPEAFRQWNKPEPALTWKDLARSFAERTIDITSGLLGACDKRHENVLVMINTSMTRPLFNFVSRDMCTKRPLVFFRNQRKDFKFLLSGLKAGIGFVAHPRRRRLGEDDHRKVHAIVEKVRARS